MKVSRALVVVLSLAFLCGLTFAAKMSYNIQADLQNAIQHIWAVRLLNGSDVIVIESQNTNVKMGGASNFLVTWNAIELSEKSSVLWWKWNKVQWSSYSADKLTASTIVAWRSNTIQSDYSIVNGWERNNIALGSDNSVIMWGVENNIYSDSRSSVIVGGSNNKVEWEYSTVAWTNSKIEWNYSVALWSDVTVEWNNSFFWSDGSTARKLTEDWVFVIMSEHGMVINTGVAHTWVQLTLNGSLVVSQNSESIKCEGGEWIWIMRLVDKGDSVSTQKCLCSCDGDAWHSLVWNWQCETVCNGTNQAQPKCWTGLSVSRASESDPWTYLWSCEAWFPISDSYLVIRYASGDEIWDKIYWTCQENNGSVAYSGCEYVIKCEWTIPANAHRNNNIVPSLDPSVNRNFKYADDPSVLCSYSCNDWYLWKDGACKEICNRWAWSCYIGTRSDPDTQWTQNYNYLCNYTYNWGNHSYSCDMSCPSWQIWGWVSKGCVNKDSACGSEKYTCSLWTPSKTTMDEEDRVGKDFTWMCLNWLGTPIKVCSKAKPRVDKEVYFNANKAWKIETARFTIVWSITSAININLPYSTVNWWNVVDDFTIDANTVSSKKKSYDSSLGNITLNWPMFVDDEIPQWEIVHKLRIVEWEIDNYCAGSCSMAGQCLYGATSSNYSSSKNWNQASFTWKCAKWWKSQNCSASCRINTSSCNSVPSWATACDATADSDCVPLSSQTTTVNLDNFYMYSTEEVIASSDAWTKRHCVKGSSGYVNYTVETKYTKQDWFKCNYGKVLSWCNCVDICTSTNGVWKCNGGGTVTLPWATWTTGYNYTCTLESTIYNCSASCPSGKYWNWSSCASAPTVCDTTHYDCKNDARMWENVHIDASHIYKWKCTLWDIQKQCLECETHYTLNGTTCIPTTVPCDKNDNLGWYKVPAMNHGETENVVRTDSTQRCTNTATCTNGTITLGTESCTDACKKSTNPWTCNLSLSPTNYAWTKWWYSYTYSCGDFSCGVTCDTWKIWNGSKCEDKVNPCGSTAKQCLQWTYEKKTSNTAGDTRNCLDAGGNKLNSSICYKCSSGYERNGSKCARPCKTADNVTWADWKTWDAYKGTQYTCSDSCSSNAISVRCDDGDFVKSAYPYDKITIPLYNSCTTKSVSCNSTTYPLTTQPSGDYESCTPYSVSNNSCSAWTTRYKLNGCDCWSYKNGNSCTPCGEKKYSSAWATSCNTAEVWYYANSSCKQTACSNAPANARYTSNASSNSCSWVCDEWYYKNSSNTCTKCEAWYYCTWGSKTACGAGKWSGAWSSSCSNIDCWCYWTSGTKSCPNSCGEWKYSSAWSSSCSTADVWYYANSSCSQTACTNKPEHSSYTSNGSSNNCSYSCSPNYSSTYPLTSCPTWWNCSDTTSYEWTNCSATTRYKLNSCDSCDEYTLSSCPANWYCSECISYTKNGNSCTAWTTRYKLYWCNPWYQQSGNTCVAENVTLTAIVQASNASSYEPPRNIRIWLGSNSYWSDDCVWYINWYGFGNSTCTFTVPLNAVFVGGDPSHWWQMVSASLYSSAGQCSYYWWSTLVNLSYGMAWFDGVWMCP